MPGTIITVSMDLGAILDGALLAKYLRNIFVTSQRLLKGLDTAVQCLWCILLKYRNIYSRLDPTRQSILFAACRETSEIAL